MELWLSGSIPSLRLFGPSRVLDLYDAGYPSPLNHMAESFFIDIIVLSIGAAGNVAVLVTSNGANVDTWARGIQPGTFLSTVAAISNLFLAFMYQQGLVQSFWIRCLRGSLVMDLHHQWDAGQSVWGACRALAAGKGLLSAFSMLTVALATLLRSPLNQAAVRVVQQNVTSQGTFTLQVAQVLPNNYTAYGVGDVQYGNASEASAYLTSSFISVMLGYNNRAAMTMIHSGCGDSCETTVNGFGFHADCTTVPQDQVSDDLFGEDLAMMFSTDVNIWAQNLSANYTALNATSYMSENKRRLRHRGESTYDTAVYNAGLNVSIYYQGEDWNTTLRHCLLQPSIMAYPVTLTNNSVISLGGGWSTDKTIQTLNNYTGPFFYESDGGDTYHSTYMTTVGGFQYAASTIFKSSAFINDSSMPIFEGLMSNLYYNDTSTSWSDPTDDILNAIRELSFRTSLYAAKDTLLKQTEDGGSSQAMRSNQTVQYTGYTSTALYSTEWPYMAAGLVVSFLAILGVLPLYRGFSELGRDVSMNPFEIAKAFEAPLLANAGSNCKASGIARQVGNRHIQYGTSTTEKVEGSSSYPRLRFGLYGNAPKPDNGAMYT